MVVGVSVSLSMQSMPTCELSGSLESDVGFVLKTSHAPIRDKLWNFFPDPESSRAASKYHAAMNPLLTWTVLITVLQHVRPAVFSEWVFAILETTFEVLLFIEFCLRALVSPSKIAILFDVYNSTDLFI